MVVVPARSVRWVFVSKSLKEASCLRQIAALEYREGASKPATVFERVLVNLSLLADDLHPVDGVLYAGQQEAAERPHGDVILLVHDQIRGEDCRP